MQPESTSAALYEPKADKSPGKLIRKTNFKKIDIICGCDALDHYNRPPDSVPMENQLVVKHFIETVQKDYDFVLIDNPPNLQICTFSSLAASNFTYCITMPQEFDLQGLVPVQKAVDTILDTTNPNLRFAGYVLNMVKVRRSIHNSYESLLRQTYGRKVFSTTIPDWNLFAESLSFRQPISFYKPNSNDAKANSNIGSRVF